MIPNRSMLLLFVFFPQVSFTQPPIPDWKMVESLDTNKDDRITLEEFVSAPTVFQAIDVNQDQVITRTEVLRARKKSPQAPVLHETAPKLSALDPGTGKMIPLHGRDRPYALIFGTHT